MNLLLIVSHVYTPDTGVMGMLVDGTTATVDPVISEGEQEELLFMIQNGIHC